MIHVIRKDFFFLNSKSNENHGQKIVSDAKNKPGSQLLTASMGIRTWFYHPEIKDVMRSGRQIRVQIFCSLIFGPGHTIPVRQSIVGT